MEAVGQERGELKKYACNRYPSYSIRHLYFEGGFYQTDLVAEQELIEGSDGFNIFIFLQDGPAPKEETAKAFEPPPDKIAGVERVGGVRRGGIDTRSKL
jgi:hypothetical protein